MSVKKQKRRANRRPLLFLFLPVLVGVVSCLIPLLTDLQTPAAAASRKASSSSKPASSAASPVMKANGLIAMKLIDVSHKTTITDWNAVSRNVDGIYIKATEGVTYTDQALDAYAKAAASVKIPFGFYHYFWPTADVQGAKQQADIFYSAIKPYPYAFYPVLDIEQTNGQSAQTITADVKAFSEEFEQKAKQKLMLYCSPHYANKFLTDTFFSGCPLWIADYNVASPENTQAWHAYEMWQYGESTVTPGVSGEVDGDIATNGIYLTAPKTAG